MKCGVPVQSVLCIVSSIASNPPRPPSKENMEYLYVGTYTTNIYIFEGAEHSGWTPKGVVPTLGNPSFLVANGGGDRLYAVNELNDFDGQTGFVSAFSIDRSTGSLTFLNSQPTDNGPAHLAIDPTEKYLVVANYGGGSVFVFPLEANGSIGSVSHSVKPNATSRAHMVTFNPNRGYTVAVFLGLDTVLFYVLKSETGELQEVVMPLHGDNSSSTSETLKAVLPEGSGPRHLVYGKDGGYFYVVNEMASTVAVFSVQKLTNGSSEPVQVLSTVPVDYKSKTYAGAIDRHPSGKYLYATNRGHDSVVVFSVDDFAGNLTTVQHVSSNGVYPRHLVVDGSGKFLLVSNQKAGGVQVMHIDSDSGRLSPGQHLDVPSSVCALLVPK